MTRKPWNTGVAIVVLTMLLVVGPKLQAGADETQASAQPAVATVHHVDTASGARDTVEIHVESLQGVLASKGDASRPGRLILMNSRIPDDLAGRLEIGHPALDYVDLKASGWGADAQAQIDLGLPPGVHLTSTSKAGATSVQLRNGEATYTIKLLDRPYPAIHALDPGTSGALKAHLQDVAKARRDVDTGAWWSGTENGRMKAMLREVRDADVRVDPAMREMYAAQFAPKNEEETPVEGSEPEEAPAEEAPAEAPAVEEAEPATDTAPPPPAPRPTPPPVTSAPEAQDALVKEMRKAAASQERPESTLVKGKPYRGDPLRRPITVNFSDVELGEFVASLKQMAGINVVANYDLGPPVDLYLEDVPLMKAMETALRLNGLGIVEEEGIYYIRPYEETIAADRTTELVVLEYADVAEIASTLENTISRSIYQSYITITPNENASTVIISGPEKEVAPLVRLASRLDVEQQALPTVTMPIKLNYAAPEDMLQVIQPILTKENEIGQVTVDSRARILVVTDIPIIVEKITDLVKQLDIPAKSVAIEGLIVDVTLSDAADTGVDWLISAVQSQSRRDAAGNTGVFTGNLQELSLDSNLSIGDAAGLLNFGILSGDIDWRGVIQAEVRNNNSSLISNPKLITVENQPATITIASEIPYQEIRDSEFGGQISQTEFKPIGTTLEVTPTVTHDDHIIATIIAKESTTSQVVNGIPVEDKREISTTPHIKSGQTIYVGGLRKNNDTTTVRKVPVLGDVPIVNFLFRSNQRNEAVNELLIFLTCSVLDQEQALTEYQKMKADQVRDARVEVSAETRLIHDTVYPGEMRDPAWKWRKHRKETRE